MKFLTNELREFEERKLPDLSNLFSFKETEYITVQPMANESEILAELGMKPSDCIKVDLYWKYKNQIIFLQINSIEFLENKQLGIYARCDLPRSSVIIMANTRAKIISREIVESILDKLLKEEKFEEDISTNKLKDEFVYLYALPDL